MAVSSAAARTWLEPDEPVAPLKQRTWAQNVPYDVIDAEESPIALTPPARARRPAPATQRLQSVPGGKTTTTFRPVAAADPAATRVYETAPAPRAVARPAALPALRMAVYAFGAAAAAVILYVVLSSIVTWTQIKLDDVTYGNPRTTHLDAVVGNGDSAAQPTHFIALNLNRQVSILELPGGDISKAVAISGPYLFGDGEDLTPVKLRAEDLNGDGKPDLLVTVKNEELAYINDKGTFRPITAEEKTKLEAAPAPAAGK